jgi:hypothetical protein
LSGLFDPLFHSIGQTLLTAPALQVLYTRLYELPFAPWTAFNNTIVCGSALVGLTAFYPTYRLSLPVFELWHRWKKKQRSDEENAAEEKLKRENTAQENTPQRNTEKDNAALVRSQEQPASTSPPVPVPRPGAPQAAPVMARPYDLKKSRSAITAHSPKQAESAAIHAVATEPIRSNGIDATRSSTAEEFGDAKNNADANATETDAIAKDVVATDGVENRGATNTLSLAEPPEELRFDAPHNSPRNASKNAGGGTDESVVAQRGPRRPHYLPPQAQAVIDLDHTSVRETLQRRRFKQFVAEVESISRRVA